jgi:hypothetical protein
VHDDEVGWEVVGLNFLCQPLDLGLGKPWAKPSVQVGMLGPDEAVQLIERGL